MYIVIYINLFIYRINNLLCNNHVDANYKKTSTNRSISVSKGRVALQIFSLSKFLKRFVPLLRGAPRIRLTRIRKVILHFSIIHFDLQRKYRGKTIEERTNHSSR